MYSFRYYQNLALAHKKTKQQNKTKQIKTKQNKKQKDRTVLWIKQNTAL